MSASTTEYPKSLLHGVSPTVDTLKVALVHAYTYDPTHEFFSDVQAEELAAAGGYAAGGVTLTGVVATWDVGTKTYTFTCDDPTWATATFAAGGAVLYRSTGVAATSPLISYTDFGGDQSPSDQNFSIHCPATGFYQRSITAGGA